MCIRDRHSEKVFSQIQFSSEYTDSLDAKNGAIEIIQELNSKGFLLASLDSFWFENEIAHAQIFVGERMEWIELTPENIPNSFLSKVGFQKNNFRGKSFNLLKINELKEKILVQFENSGHPFAQIKLDEIHVENGKVSGRLFAEEGPKIYFNKLENYGNIEISQRYLENYLGIKENEPFDRSKVCLLYTSPSPRDATLSRMPSSA